jgi:hypothetical protein
MNPLKTLLAKMSEMNEMRKRMREKGVNECFNLLPNPRLLFPCFISPKKLKKNTHLPPHAHGPAGAFLGSVFFLGSVQGAFAPWTLPERSLKNQGAQFSVREHAP